MLGGAPHESALLLEQPSSDPPAETGKGLEDTG